MRTIVIEKEADDEGLGEPEMNCLVCKQGETRPGKAAVVLQRDGVTVVINDVPARVCGNCGEEYVDERVAESVLASSDGSARAGVRVKIRDYLAPPRAVVC